VAKFDQIYQKGSKIVLKQHHYKWDLREFIRSHKVVQAVQNERLRIKRNFKPLETLPLATLKSILKQILKGLVHCHDQNVMHRNLKPENILIDPDQEGSTQSVKTCISDFAYARACSAPYLESYTPEDPKDRDRSGRETRRLFYRAPELMFRPNIYSFKVDMWAVGCLLAEMALGDALFKQSSELELLLRIFRVTGSPDHDLINKYIMSGTEFKNPMLNFPAWTRIPFQDLCEYFED
jgi:serine/threonine protein kinase